MDWKDLASKVADAAPLLGGLLGGPAGGAVGALIAGSFGAKNTPEDVASVIANPEAAVKLREIEANCKVQLQQLAVTSEANRLQAETAELQSVNTTMQAEAKAEHWPTYTWRPFVGFVFGVMTLGVYFVLPLARLPVPEVPNEAWLALGAVLGVASWHRGRTQLEQVRADANAEVKG